MAVKKTGRGLIIVGAAGIVMALLLILALPGRPDIPSISILTIEISAILVFAGLWLSRRETSEELQLGRQIQNLLDQILDLPIITWVLIGFLFIYLMLSMSPMFLSSNLQMNYLVNYIPNLNPIGNDLTEMVGLIKGWATENQSPYITQRFYPPLTYIFFTPLLLIKDQLALYRLFTLFTFFSYCFLTLWLPLKIINKKHFLLALLLFITGLFSYGFQFELERGQYNIITFLFCLTSVYIFHYHPKYRLPAYFLFSLSIQLKLYPAIFVVMFVDDWRAWKNIILRFLGLGIFNFVLFFIMGYQRFWEFIHSMTAQIINPSWMGPWNHSISSFVNTVKQDGLGLIRIDTLRVFRHNSEWAEVVLLLSFTVLFIFNLIISYMRNGKGIDSYLLLTCTIGMLVIPISYDYTLSMLAAPMLLFLSGIPEMNNWWSKLVSILLILGTSVAYFSTLTSYNYRPHFLINAFPLLFLILMMGTILNFIQYKKGKEHFAAKQPAVQEIA